MSKTKLSHDRRSVGQSILVSNHHPKPATNFSFTSMENIFRHLRVSSCVAPSLMSGRVCNLSVQLSHLRLSSISVTSYYSQGYSGDILTRPYTASTRVQIQVILRLTVSRPIYPGIRPPSGTSEKIFFFFPPRKLSSDM
jgi:hypothetical protein